MDGGQGASDAVTDRPIRLLVTEGGTGGHTYPALTATRTLQRRFEVSRSVEVLWVGTADGLEARTAEREGISFVAVAASKVRRARNPLKMLSWANLTDMAKVPCGVVQAVRAVRTFRPDVVLATGGYVSVPVSLAAWVCRRPLVVHEQTVRLGLANRLLARIATVMAVSSASTLPLLPQRARGSDGPTKYCDHAAVGVLISSPAGLLVSERVRFPAGIAPVAGHVDQLGGPEQAACAEVSEDVGLTVTSLQLVTSVWRHNRCRRPVRNRVGHQWSIYRAEASGQIRPAPQETRAPRWLPPGQLQQHARRTAACAKGQPSDEQFAAAPGLEPVWVRFLHQLGLVTVPDDVLDRIENIL